MDYNIDYYKILGLDNNSSTEEIKKQFKKLSKIHHPDVKNGNESKFKELNNAYSILSDAKTKQDYDRNSTHGNSYTQFSSFGNNGFEFHFGSGSDIFSQFFGGTGFDPFGGFGQSRREEFNEHLEVELTTTINLKQIYLNENLNVKYKRFMYCDECKGTGFDKNDNSDECEICNGTGNNNGQTCEYCMGEGKIYTEQCKNCKGEKVVLKDTEVTLQNISKLRNNIRNLHPGYGHQSKYYREKTGGLILNINVDRHDDYQIVNDDLYKTIDIHYQDAIDGTEIEYKHIDDTILNIKLPEKTQNGNNIRIKEKGLLRNDNNRADLLLKINIIIDYDKLNNKK